MKEIVAQNKTVHRYKESEETYRRIVDVLPDATIITIDGKVVLANKEALKYNSNLIGERIDKYVPDFIKTLSKRTNQILENKIKKTIFDYRVVVDNDIIDLEISSGYIEYNERPAILSIMRDITERKRELNSAAKMQKKILKKPHLFQDKAKIEILYVPAKTVSGDFFYVHKINDDLFIGMIGDVSGKGVTAALSISAFNVLFHEAVLCSQDPFEIVENLNRKVVNYLGERYVAVCCFSFDFKENKAKIVGAGINQFIYEDRDGYELRVVKGPFLGMFENTMFDEKIIHFKSGDKFYFFTDGLDFIFDNGNTTESYLKQCTIAELKNNIEHLLNDMLTDVDGIKDDCTLLALEIN